jgi:hypothetical protein
LLWERFLTAICSGSIAVKNRFHGLCVYFDWRP